MTNPIQTDRFRFPAWRLPKGTKNASDHDLEAASSSCESWEIGCAGVVVAAVAAEFAIAGFHPPYDSFLEQWGSAAANAFVALGIVGEVIFSGKDAHIQTELRERSNAQLAKAAKAAGEAETRAADALKEAAELRLKAAEAELQVEELKKRLSPREIDPSAFLQTMQGKPKAPVEVKYVRDDPDSFKLAISISSLLKQADWPVEWASPIDPNDSPNGWKQPSAVAAGGQPTGVTVVGHMLWRREDEPAYWDDDSHFNHNAFTALCRALSLAMVGYGSNVGLSIVWPPDRLRVIVGPRQ